MRGMHAGLRRTVAEYSSWVSAAHAAASPPPPPSGDTVSSSTVAGAGAGGCGFVAFTCSSWLLDPHYQDVLSEHSNIVKFQRECYCYPTGAYSIVRKNGESVLRSNFADLPRHARDKHNQESLSEPVLAPFVTRKSQHQLVLCHSAGAEGDGLAGYERIFAPVAAAAATDSDGTNTREDRRGTGPRPGACGRADCCLLPAALTIVS
jgi:hypothetical protein